MTSPGKILNESPEGGDVRTNEIFLTVPFAVVAIVAELSLALSPRTDSLSAAIVSLVLLAAAVTTYFTFMKRGRPWNRLLVPLFYSGSVLALVIASGSSSSGVGLVMLLSVVWTALYLEVWQSVIVVSFVGVCEFVTSIVPDDLTNPIRMRRVVMYLLVSSLIVFSVQQVRRRVARVSEERELLNDGMQLTIGALEESLRSASVLSHLVDMLNSCDSREEAYEVIEHAAERMFVTGGTVSAFDASNNQLETKCAWGELSGEHEAFSTNDCWALRRGHEYESNKGEITCKHLRGSGVAHTFCRPLLAQGEVMGVLTIAMSDLSVEPPLAQIVGIIDPFPQIAMSFGEQISIWMANFNLREILRHQSIRDPLTNLFNRRHLEEALVREISKATRTFEQISAIQIDIDSFKSFNDGYGHAVGDEVLVAIAEVILALFRGSDVPCRSGGEEFTVLLPNCSWGSAHERCVELQRRVADIRITTSQSRALLTPPTLSIGIATSPEHGLTSQALLRSADLALYASKSDGRNRISRALPETESPQSDATSLKVSR